MRSCDPRGGGPCAARDLHNRAVGVGVLLDREPARPKGAARDQLDVLAASGLHPLDSTLALPKTGLKGRKAEICLGDIGIPREVYDRIAAELGPVFGHRYRIRLIAS